MKTSLAWGLLAVCFAPWSNSSTAAAPPPPPQNVRPAWIHGWPVTYARLNWDASPGAGTYKVYRFNDGTSAWENFASDLTNVIAFDFDALAAERSYYVTAVGPEGESGASEVVTTHDSDYLPSFSHTPPDWWPYSVTPTSATIQWVVSLTSGADGMLEMGTNPTNLAIVGFHPDYAFGHSFVLTNLTPATQYYYRMTSVGTNRAGTAVTRTFTTPDINHPPTANDISLGPVVDPWPITVQLTGSDPDGTWSPLEFLIITAPTNGTITDVYYYDYWGARFVDYTPNPGARGADFFQYVANDGELDSAPATVSIANLWLNRTPQPVSFSTNALEDVPLSLTSQASDEDGDALTFTFGGCLHGTVTGTPPNLIYTPNPNFHGSDLVLFDVQDGFVGGLAQGIINIEVQSVNDAPVAEPPSYVLSLPEDDSYSLLLAGSDVEQSALAFMVVDGPAHGSLIGTPPQVTYSPAPNYNGPDSFTFRVNDGELDSAPVAVSIVVTPINDAPIATAQSVTLAEDSSIDITLAATDVEGQSLTYTVLDGPHHGTLTGTPPNLIYAPAPNFNGGDNFTFLANDGLADGLPAEISITVSPVNDGPVADALTVTTVEDTAASVVLTGSDVDSVSLIFALVDGPAHGSLSGSPPNLTYTPAENFAGQDSFTYRASDGVIESAITTASITIAPVNDTPTANSQSVTTPYNTLVNITLTGSDVDGDTLAYAVLSSPVNGTLTGTAPNLIFTPNLNWFGTTSFTFMVNDGSLNSGPATVMLTVSGPTSVPPAPAGLTATAISRSRIDLAWADNSNSESGFKIERSANGSSWSQIATVGPNVRNYSSTGLSANKTYYYRVRAYNSLGNSAYSNTASAKTLR